MEKECSLCSKVLLPLDCRRPGSFRSNTCKIVKATVRDLLSVPLEEIDALNESAVNLL